MTVTSTGARLSARAASMPPKPAPTMTTRGRRSGMRITPPSLRLFDARDRGGAFADDEDDRILVLGAVPMHLLAEMGHERPRVHRHRIVGIPLVAGADPPGALEHRDEAVIGMEMRMAEIVPGEPLVDHHVEPGLFRIADQYAVAAAAGAFPLDLVGQLEDQSLRIELHRCLS